MAVLGEPPSTIAHLKAECERLENVETERRQLTQHLFNRIEEAENLNTHLRNEVERLKRLENLNYLEIVELEEIKKDLLDRLDTAPFVIVLVDGDSTLFLDDLVQAGLRGGRDAAHILHDHLKEDFRSICDFKHHWRIIVRIFANFNGLTKAYCDAGVVFEPRIVREFIVGFNREIPFFEFVDAGSDKEASDNKIQENFQLYHYIEQCKHVMLACSGDKGYVTFLRQYSAHTDGVTLLKSLPFPKGFRILAQDFLVKEYQDVFRVDKLNSGMLHPSLDTHGETRAVWTIQQSLQTSTASTPKYQATTLIDVREHLPQEPPEQKLVWLNKHEERLDPPLQCDQRRVQELLPEKLCLRYFMATCEKPLYSCYHRHDYRGETTLSTLDQQALSRIARMNPCRDGLKCRDHNCIYGHECCYGSKCTYENCKFGNMHNVSRDGKHLSDSEQSSP